MENKVVYAHKIPNDKGVFYIGMGSPKRAHANWSRTKHWHNIVNKYGIEVEICAKNLSVEQAKKLEKIFIKLYGRKDTGKGLLINLTDGGEHSNYWKGRKLSEEHKNKLKQVKISEERKEAARTRMMGNKYLLGHKDTEETKKKKVVHLFKENNGMYNKTHSDETKAKMREGQRRYRIKTGYKY